MSVKSQKKGIKIVDNYLQVLGFSLLFFFLAPQGIVQQIFSVIALIIVLIPVGIFLMKKRSLFVWAGISILLLLVIFLTTFRLLRDSAVPAYVSGLKVVGYVHYFGYSYFLDTVIFFLILLFPLFFIAIYKKRTEKNYKKYL